MGQTNDALKFEVERWFKLSLPAMCLVFTLCAPPLALRFSRAGGFTRRAAVDYRRFHRLEHAAFHEVHRARRAAPAGGRRLGHEYSVHPDRPVAAEDAGIVARLKKHRRLRTLAVTLCLAAPITTAVAQETPAAPQTPAHRRPRHRRPRHRRHRRKPGLPNPRRHRSSHKLRPRSRSPTIEERAAAARRAADNAAGDRA